MDTNSRPLNRSPPPPNANSPSIRSSGLSVVSGSGVSSGQASTRESSPDLQPRSSSSSSSSGIEPSCDGDELQDTMENQHHYNPFESLPLPPYPGHQNTNKPGGGAVGPDYDPCSSSPLNQGFNPYNSTPLLAPGAASMPHQIQAATSFTGLSSQNTSHRGLTSSNWRTTPSSSPTANLPPTSGAEHYQSSLLPSSLLPAFSEQQTNLGNYSQFYNQFHHHQTLSRPTAMSSPIASLSPPSSPPSICNASVNGPGNGNGIASSTNNGLNSSEAVRATTHYGTPPDNNPSSNNNPSGYNPGNVLSPNSLLLAQVTHALAQNQGQSNGGLTEMPCYGYCFDRGNGQYTRLIPADMLPPLVDIPARQQGCVGMTILPCPSGLAPNGRSSNLERVLIQPTPVPTTALTLRGGNGARDPIQSRIDSIVATTPAPVIETQRKQKIYCDKWIHEGVCAFTQQGCKYKHEMPLDKDTQESLGLFQGLPVWWRKHQSEIGADQQSGDTMAAISSAVLTAGGHTGRARAGTGGRGGFGGQNRLRQNTWRSAGAGQGRVGAAGGAAGGSGQPASPQGARAGGQVAQFSSPFGPIAPPSANPGNTGMTRGAATASLAGSSIIHRNPWSTLKSETADDDAKDAKGN